MGGGELHSVPVLRAALARDLHGGKSGHMGMRLTFTLTCTLVDDYSKYV